MCIDTCKTESHSFKKCFQWQINENCQIFQYVNHPPQYLETIIVVNFSFVPVSFHLHHKMSVYYTAVFLSTFPMAMKLINQNKVLYLKPNFYKSAPSIKHAHFKSNSPQHHRMGWFQSQTWCTASTAPNFIPYYQQIYENWYCAITFFKRTGNPNKCSDATVQKDKLSKFSILNIISSTYTHQSSLQHVCFNWVPGFRIS